MTNTDVIKKLIGPVMPQGDEAFDGERLENLKEMCEVTKNLVYEIDAVLMRGREWNHLASVKKAEEYADKFLTSLGITDE